MTKESARTDEPQDEASIMEEVDHVKDMLLSGEISSTIADLLVKGCSVKLRARRSWVEQHKLELAKKLLADLKKSMRTGK